MHLTRRVRSTRFHGMPKNSSNKKNLIWMRHGLCSHIHNPHGGFPPKPIPQGLVPRNIPFSFGMKNRFSSSRKSFIVISSLGVNHECLINICVSMTLSIKWSHGWVIVYDQYFLFDGFLPSFWHDSLRFSDQTVRRFFLTPLIWIGCFACK